MRYSHIIVTRVSPGHQRLLDALADQADQLIWAPVLLTKPMMMDPEVHSDVDDVIMVSPASVQYAPVAYLSQAKRLWVMGTGSAQHVPAIWQDKVKVLPGVHNSEEWVEKLEDVDWSNRRVCLLKGQYGRSVLKKFLSVRAQSYEEKRVYYTVCQSRADCFNWQKIPPSPQVVIQVSSLEVLRGLIHLLGPQGCQWLQDCTLLVSGARQASVVHKMPFLKRVVVANGASISDICLALLTHKTNAMVR